MAELDVALGQLENLLTSFHKFKQYDKLSDRVTFVIEMRSKTVQTVADVAHLAMRDAKLQADPELARRFAERFQKLRHLRAGLQVKWRAVDIERDFDTYSEELQRTNQDSIDIVRWVRATR